MKTVIMSIRAVHNRNIESGAKTLELRTLPPTCELPFRVLTYESGPGGRHAVTNEWICDVRVQLSPVSALLAAPDACVDMEYICKYTNNFQKSLYSLHVSNLKVYDSPRSLGEFYRRCEKLDCEGCKHFKFQQINKNECDYDCELIGGLIPIVRAPQNYCYVAAELQELKGANNDTP